MLPGLPVRVRHGELVLIGEQRRRHGVGGRPHLRRHPRMGAVAVGVGARVRRRRLRHPGLPEELLGGGSALGLAWLRGRERLPGREGRGGEAGGDNWRPEGGRGGGGPDGNLGVWPGAERYLYRWKSCRRARRKEANDTGTPAGRQV